MHQNEIDAIKMGVDPEVIAQYEDLHCSRGPVSSLPGSSHRFPEGAKCDEHQDRLAVGRFQGETDSFGCEFWLGCQECVDVQKAHEKAHEDDEERCNWCAKMKKHCRDRRDMDEGMCGPVYRVCPDCITRENDAAAKELEEMGVDPYDDHDWDSRGADERDGLEDFREDSPQLEHAHMDTGTLESRAAFEDDDD